MNTRILCVWIALLTCQIAGAQTKNVTWGDQGNGTYINPILNADYSDPDVIRAVSYTHLTLPTKLEV
mgnify:CR=1 FL=1